jgi:hypothetical protein
LLHVLHHLCTALSTLFAQWFGSSRGLVGTSVQARVCLFPQARDGTARRERKPQSTGSQEPASLNENPFEVSKAASRLSTLERLNNGYLRRSNKEGIICHPLWEAVSSTRCLLVRQENAPNKERDFIAISESPGDICWERISHCCCSVLFHTYFPREHGHHIRASETPFRSSPCHIVARGTGLSDVALVCERRGLDCHSSATRSTACLETLFLPPSPLNPCCFSLRL